MPNLSAVPACAIITIQFYRLFFMYMTVFFFFKSGHVMKSSYIKAIIKLDAV